MTVQEAFEKQGFLIIGFRDQPLLESVLGAGVIKGDQINSVIPSDALLSITGPATEEEWNAQCAMNQEPARYPGEAFVGFLKVIAE